jgi:hypothetical protein
MTFTAAVKFGTYDVLEGAGIAQRYDGNQEMWFFFFGQWQVR